MSGSIFCLGGVVRILVCCLSEARIKTRIYRSLPLFFLALIGFFSSFSVMAGCYWTGVNPNRYNTGTTIVLENAGRTLLANRFWVESSRNRIPKEAFLGIAMLTMSSGGCDGGTLSELNGHRVNVVYVPPASAEIRGGAYRVPTSNPSVSFDIEFPDGRPGAGGILLGTSMGNISGGILPVVAVRNVRIKISLVKTGDLSVATMDDDSIVIVDRDGLGELRYYSSTEPTLMASFSQPLKMPLRYTPADLKLSPLLGQAYAPFCTLEGAVGATVTLAPVSSSAFRGIGAVDQGSAEKQFPFECQGAKDTQAELYFDTPHPLGGATGVGMPDADSDVGIQVLFEDKPIGFGLEHGISVVNGEMMKLIEDYTDRVTTFSSQGHFCTTNCTDDMTAANWINTKPSRYSGVGVKVRFKYYQTKNIAPKPTSGEYFQVPFTVTLNVQ